MSDVLSKPEESGVDVFKGLPRRLHIGAHTFRVVITSHAKGCDDLKDNFGVTDFEAFTIHLNEDMPPHQALVIVQHEITHCINDVFGVTDKSTEEQFTTQHSKGLVELWLRNPRLYTWMTKTLKRVKKEASRD